MLEKAGHDPDTSRDIIRKALLSKDLCAHTCLSDGRYDPTGVMIDFDNTDWAGTAAWVAVLTGRIPWPLNEDTSDEVPVLVNVRDAEKWITKVTGGVAKRKASADDEENCEGWLINQMHAGPKRMKKSDYHANAQTELKVKISFRQFGFAWSNAIQETGSDWGKPGPIDPNANS